MEDSNKKLRILIAKTELMIAKMDIEIKKSPKEWDRVCDAITKVGIAKLHMRRRNQDEDR